MSEIIVGLGIITLGIVSVVGLCVHGRFRATISERRVVVETAPDETGSKRS